MNKTTVSVLEGLPAWQVIGLKPQGQSHNTSSQPERFSQNKTCFSFATAPEEGRHKSRPQTLLSTVWRQLLSVRLHCITAWEYTHLVRMRRVMVLTGRDVNFNGCDVELFARLASMRRCEVQWCRNKIVPAWNCSQQGLLIWPSCVFWRGNATCYLVSRKLYSGYLVNMYFWSWVELSPK